MHSDPAHGSGNWARENGQNEKICPETGEDLPATAPLNPYIDGKPERASVAFR
jgi:hypothetical protein